MPAAPAYIARQVLSWAASACARLGGMILYPSLYKLLKRAAAQLHAGVLLACASYQVRQHPCVNYGLHCVH